MKGANKLIHIGNIMPVHIFGDAIDDLDSSHGVDEVGSTHLYSGSPCQHEFDGVSSIHDTANAD